MRRTYSRRVKGGKLTLFHLGVFCALFQFDRGELLNIHF